LANRVRADFSRPAGFLGRRGIIVLVPSDGKYTPKQGQYLSFIYYYTKIHGIAPAEAEIQHYFRVTPPSVHQMILMLEQQGFITRTPGAARSIRLLLGRPELPDLE
jgi:repressor LexA